MSYRQIFNTHNLNRGIWIIGCLWLIVPILIVVTVQDIEQSSDAFRYQTLAEECFRNGKWYPMPQHIENLSMVNGEYPTYVVYPGYINLLEIYLYLFGTYKIGFWFNILFNCITAWCVYALGRNLRNDKFAKIALCLFFLYPLQITSVGMTLSEFPCIALTYLSLVLASRRKYGWIVASGVIMVLSAYIRSVTFLFAIGVLAFMLVKRYGWKLIATYVVTIVSMYFLIVSFNRSLTGYNFFGSTTLGINILIGANEDCHGAYNEFTSVDPSIIDKTEGKNTFQIDSIQKAYAFEWIKENPGRWVALALPKIYYELHPASIPSLGRYDKCLIKKETMLTKVFFICVKVYGYFYQLMLLGLAFAGIWIRRKELCGVDGAILLPFLGSLALAILTVGDPRYNMPYIPILIWFAVWSILHIMNLRKLNRKC